MLGLNIFYSLALILVIFTILRSRLDANGFWMAELFSLTVFLAVELIWLIQIDPWYAQNPEYGVGEMIIPIAINAVCAWYFGFRKKVAK